MCLVTILQYEPVKFTFLWSAFYSFVITTMRLFIICRYLSTRMKTTEKSKYHFFNSFFFRKLADLDKDQGRAPEGRSAFLRVRKWTRKINIFAKDFLFIPVNFRQATCQLLLIVKMITFVYC